MKPVINYLKLIFTVLVVTFIQAASFAQETTSGGSSTSTTKVEVTTDTNNWFSDNWIWVVGVVVFIILLFALMGSGRSSRTTVVREDRAAGTGRVTRTTTVDDDI